MSKDWWPSLLSHIPQEAPWKDDHVVVAEIKSFDEKPHAGIRRTFAALVPVDDLKAVAAALANLDHNVSTSGPHPSYFKDSPYLPCFRIDAVDLPSKHYDPLILSWASHDLTVLQPDPGFLMTYGLMPRAGMEGFVHWDDPKEPRHDIVIATPPSRWNWPLATHAYVCIERKFLQDYLTLRHMALVQVYFEQRWGLADADAKAKLGAKEGIAVEFPDRRFQLGFSGGPHKAMFAQVWGARLVAEPKDTPISADSLDDDGLLWPGIDKPVTNHVAQTLGMDYVYVDDSVLGEYEGRPAFEVFPASGSIKHGTQWSVSYCTRVDRNLIRLEVRKLYEGVPPSVIRLWHKYAVAPVPLTAYPAILHTANIGTRAKAITYALVGLGEALSRLTKDLGMEVPPEDLVSLGRSTLDYHGWWTFDGPKAIARHVPPGLNSDDFLDRCLSLDQLITEGLSEAELRKTLISIGIPGKDLKDFRTLKLLDAIIRVAQITTTTGLDVATDGAELWSRLATDGTKPPQPIAHLFALHDVRLLKAHKASDRAKELREELKRFDVSPGEEAAGYGKILDQIYDILAKEIEDATHRLTNASP